jgi:hypothetical protein
MDRSLSILFLSVLFVGLFFAGANTCYGQAYSANLTGLVTDPNNAAIPGATVKIRNTDTDDTRETHTGAEGRYTLSQLLPGRYELSAEASGFRTIVQRGITLQANQSADIPIAMQLGEVTQSVEVVAAAPVIDTLTANQSVTITSNVMTDLPVGIRTPFAMVQTLAGTTNVVFGSPTAIFDQTYSGFALNGGRDMSGLILIDGIPATATDWNGLMASPAMDSVQEMQVIRNSYDAQFGKSGGGVVSLVTRSGSTAFHGSAWEFLRNDNLDANSWDNNRAGAPKTEMKRSQFGANIGGPIWNRKHLHFFAGYEGLRDRTPGSSSFVTLPTDLERQGDFSQTFNVDGSKAIIYNPFTTRQNPNGDGYIRDAFAGNRIPQSMFDPVAAKVTSMLPLPNLPGDPITHAQNYYETGKGVVTNDRLDARIDWAHNDKHTMYGRMTWAPRQNNVAPLYFNNGLDNVKSDVNPRYHMTWGNTFVPSPTWVINVLVGSGRWREGQLSASDGMGGEAIGFSPEAAGMFQGKTIPNIDLGGYLSLSNNEQRSFIRYIHDLQVNATKERGAHSIKFGFAAESGRINSVVRVSPNFSFGRGMTSGPFAQLDSTESGNGMASFLLGTGAGGGSQINGEPAMNLMYYAGYLQDDWKVNSRLTLNFGMRYELQKPVTERFDRLAYFDFNAVNPLAEQTGMPLNGGFRWVTSGDRGGWVTDKTDFAPRIGLAYKVSSKLVARAGFGIFYVPASSLISFDPDQMPGVNSYTPWQASRGGGGFFPQDLLSSPFPNGMTMPTGSSLGLATNLGGWLNQAWNREPHPTGYKQNFSFDLQYQITANTMLELGYSGSQSRKLVFGQPWEANQLPAQFLSLGSKLDQEVPNPFYGYITDGTFSGETVPLHRLLRPYPAYASISLARSTPGASASFNAMIIKLDKRFSHGLTMLSTYQWSKNIDNASEDQGWAVNDGWRDNNNMALDRSISAHDVPQSFVTSLVYELPVGKGRAFGSSMHGVPEAVLGGWQVSSIFQVHSGLPIRIHGPNPLGEYQFGSDRLDLIGDPAVSNRSPENWFNAAAYAEPAPYTIGNAPRYDTRVRSDWTRNVDFGLMKNFRPTEHTRIELRGDFINLFNTPLFATNWPGSGGEGAWYGGSWFNQATSLSNGPRNIQLGLKVHF